MNTTTTFTRPRLFLVEPDPRGPEQTLDEAIVTLLADPDHGTCLVCAGLTHAIPGGVACGDCGSELLVGDELVDQLQAA